MSASDNPLPLVLIGGPTASGKSSLALALSRQIPVTIINADASQVYRDLQIVSARPDAQVLKEAPHRLYGHIDGAMACSAADWAAEARGAISACREKWRLPVLVGGTGLYLQTLLYGIAPVPEIDPEIRADVRALDVTKAFACLTQEDPLAAAHLSPRDSSRIARALEVVRSTGRSLKEWQADRVGGLADQVKLIPIILLPPREWLYQRCDQRFAEMMEPHGIAEVNALLKRALDPALPVMRAIGVREIGALISRQMNHTEALESGQVATRHYAKRQYTWFRNQSPPDWSRVDAQLNDDNVNELAIKLRDMALTS